jgi:DNA helicase-2/ATP-dependent DNA helicase PcrA
MDTLNGLNPAQREAVETVEGPLLVLAGPGSGKTRVIAHRVAHLTKVWKINPHRILAVTFTNKAAKEMKERIYHLAGHSVGDMTLGTFHAVCSRILRQDGGGVGLDPRFVIYDEEDQLNLIKRGIRDLGLDPKQYSPKAIQSAISAAKSRLLTVEDYSTYTRSYFEEVVARVYERYEQFLAQSKALDFDDLIMRTVLLFRSQPEVLSKYQRRYLHINVDEFQDTNLAQYELARQLAGRYRNICVVGDPDQSIYSWRSADLRNILNFEKDYPDARVVVLEQNYRSTQVILEAAHHVISANRERKEKNLWTENERGVPISIGETNGEQQEAQLVAAEVQHLVEEGVASAGDCAIVYRTNAQSRAVEEMFIRYGMPYKLIGGTRFYERREVKDIIAYLRLLYNPSDDVGLLRIINVPPRGIGERTISQLSQRAKGMGLSLHSALKLIAQEEEVSKFPRTARALASFFNLIERLRAKGRKLNVVDLLKEVVTETGYREYLLGEEGGDERWDNILELQTVAAEYSNLKPRESQTSFLEGVSLVSAVDELEEKPDATTLITLHQAKGLEFPVVFIVGMEEGVLPHRKSFDDPAQMEEERRLFYVGMTRAKKRLYLVRTFHRSLMGSSMANLPSRFLKDIPPHMVTSANLLPEEGKATAPLSFLKAGDRVNHTKFGDGIVINCSPVADDQEVTVAFGKEVGIKKLLLSLAPMGRINSS